MALTPKETDRLLVFAAAELARKRRGRGLKLNQPEAVALITDEVFEEARAGRAYADVIAHARSILCATDVLEGVPAMIRTLHIDAMFPDGTRLVTVYNPIAGGDQMSPGQIISEPEPVEINAGLPVTHLRATNTGDVPIHLTAHFHVFEANPRLRFNRLRAWGMRLDVAAYDAVRFEPGETREIALVPIGGRRVVHGFNDAVNGSLDDTDPAAALGRLIERGFLHDPNG